MYIVFEIQKNQNGSIGTLVNSYEDRNTAEQKYHMILSAAAVSSLPVHTAVMLMEDGYLIKKETYRHVIEEVQEAE